MEEKKLICPQCKVSFPMGKHPVSGMWECPECSHKFRPAKSDLEEVTTPTKNSFPLLSLLSMFFMVVSLLGSLTWLVPAMMAGEITCETTLSCVSQWVWDLSNQIGNQPWMVWISSLVGSFVAWFFMVRFLKGFCRVIFYGITLTFYLAMATAVVAGVWMACSPAGFCG